MDTSYFSPAAALLMREDGNHFLLSELSNSQKTARLLQLYRHLKSGSSGKMEGEMESSVHSRGTNGELLVPSSVTPPLTTFY